MSRRIKHELTYDAPLAAVAAMLGDPAFREEVCERQHVLRQTVSVTPAGAGKEVVVDQVQAATGIPSFAKKFVGDEINIVQKEIWTDAERGDIYVTIPGKPGDMKGTVRLEESGGRTTETVSLEIKVGIPLVGGKIEGLIGDLLLKALQRENEVGRDYLSR
ncbi:DUF2505 domain-containing protein [Nocardioides lianchengensis]|uniref:DUF2505 domain-containing protein n=1 Tax=Nocardioides lianchengensis TaxID=1045774 RepID=A0A1G6UU07_9ACTN|nr:DUF2505 domain-containing protein [Nocardioides lianchengensis]NYG11035.1 hypothetical protein [Nocardioides lianchengensis]SDD44744.1 Protein of unknown function [Nocardioides lianchengensis]